MIRTRKELRHYLEIEKRNYGKTNLFFALLGISETSIIWRYQKLLRKWEFHLNNNHKIRTLFLKARTNRIGLRYGLHIHPNNFDIGLKIMHLGNILVNANARVGKNCLIHRNVSLIAAKGLEDSPMLGDNCKLGVNSTLIGGISLGNEVVVAAGAVVTKSFNENHITIAGVPAKKISDNSNI